MDEQDGTAQGLGHGLSTVAFFVDQHGFNRPDQPTQDDMAIHGQHSYNRRAR